MKLACLFSGGKDSCLALHLARKEGHEIVYLLNVDVENMDSFMFHKPDLGLLERQAEELGIELIVGVSEGVENEEVDDLERLIGGVKDDVEGILVGGIASSYQGKRIKKICDKLGLEFVAPLWDFDSDRVWDELLKEGFEVVLTKVSCDGLGKEWLGKIIDSDKLEELKELGRKYKFRIDFEGGEAESSVLFMPGFKKHIKMDFDIKSEGEYRYWVEIREIK